MGGIASAAIGLAGSLFASKKASDQAKAQQKLGQQAIAAADPYAKYRPDAANKLKALMDNPGAITETAEYKSRLDAAARTIAAQGYTGSGNAIIEAANAGGAAYQQAFDNLALLSGAGVQPGQGYGAALSANQNANDNRLSGIAGVVNNGTNLISSLGGLFNKPVSTGGGAQVSSGGSLGSWGEY